MFVKRNLYLAGVGLLRNPHFSLRLLINSGNVTLIVEIREMLSVNYSFFITYAAASVSF
jgi:hypothetical protein